MTEEKEEESKQVKWQRRMKEEKRCRQCGRPLNCKSKSLCLEHLLLMRERVRKETGASAWIPGKPGRPPLAIKKKKRSFFEREGDSNE